MTEKQSAPVIRCAAPAKPQVALTFDDGPDKRYTEQVLDILRREKVKATFFVLGVLAKLRPGLLKKIVADGHLIATHSWDHPKRLPIEKWREQMKQSDAAIKAAGITPSNFYRPPHGLVNDDVRQVATEQGKVIILYTLLSSDWQRPGAEALTKQVVGTMANGGIVVLHDGGGNRSQTVEALPQIIKGLRAKGLEPVRLDELLGPNPQRISPCARALKHVAQ